jgi:hypothetical protein
MGISFRASQASPALSGGSKSELVRCRIDLPNGTAVATGEFGRANDPAATCEKRIVGEKGSAPCLRGALSRSRELDQPEPMDGRTAAAALRFRRSRDESQNSRLSSIARRTPEGGLFNMARVSADSACEIG